MSLLRYIWASLWQYRRTHLAVALGVAVATAVITGALLVGDSVRGSLRDLILQRLAGVDTVLVAEQPFREELASQWQADLARRPVRRRPLDRKPLDWKQSEAPPPQDPPPPGFTQFAPLLIVPGSISFTPRDPAGGSAQATQLSILGVTDTFWELGPGGPAQPLAGNDIAVSQAVADELHARVGDEVLVRVPLPSNIPADSTLGEKRNALTSRRLRIAAILNQGIARFSLQPSQLEPRNVFVPLATLQRLLQLPDQANAIAIGGVSSDQPSTADQQAALQQALRPTLADFGLRVDEITIGKYPESHFLQISAERLVLPPPLLTTLHELEASDYEQPVITYLANTIQRGDRRVAYSTVTGVDSTAELGPLRDDQGQPILLAEDEIALNDWAAAALTAQLGDQLTLSYYEPETTHGQLVERTTPPLTLRVIVPLEGPNGQPTAAADPQFTPELPGVTDEASISDWDLPFPLVEDITPADETYWDDHRTTPKAFVARSLAEKLWATRWGSVSAVRLPIQDQVPHRGALQDRLAAAIQPSDLGMQLLPVKQQGLAAARGTTAFEGLFLGFSFFLMASAVMLIALLFRLGAEHRAAEVGLLSATGWQPQRLRLAWLGEAAFVALAGAALGVLGGIAYAALMVHGLTTWWVAATVTPFLQLHITPRSLATGFAIGLLVSLATIAWSLWKLQRIPARQLLTGDASDPALAQTLPTPTRRAWLPAVLFLAALGTALGALAGGLADEAQAGAFFASGALVLAGLLTELGKRLKQPRQSAPSSLSLTGLSIRNARRNPGRTLLAVGLTAVASFLIVALSAFRLAPTAGGTGGFDLIATADLPLHFDLNTPAGREELGFSQADETQLAAATVRSLRVRGRRCQLPESVPNDPAPRRGGAAGVLSRQPLCLGPPPAAEWRSATHLDHPRHGTRHRRRRPPDCARRARPQHGDLQPPPGRDRCAAHTA